MRILINLFTEIELDDPAEADRLQAEGAFIVGCDPRNCTMQSEAASRYWFHST